MLEEAYDLFSYCDGYWFDVQQVHSGEHLDYAVDADVVVMYLKGGAQTHYAHVFTDAAAVGQILTRAISAFLFLRTVPLTSRSREPLAAESPSLAIIPPHDEEIRSRIMRIAGQHAQAIEAIIRPQWLESALEHALTLPDIQQRLEAMIGAFSQRGIDLLRWLDDKRGQSSEADRYSALPRQRLVNLAHHPSFVGERADLLPPGSQRATEDRRRFAAMHDFWIEKMLGRQQESVTYNVDSDAWALARLQWVNTRACELGLARRLVLITGTQRLFDATAGVPAPHGADRDFAQLYLRDPRCILGAKDFFAIPPADGSKRETGFRLQEWLPVMLPNLREPSSLVPVTDPEDPTATGAPVAETGIPRAGRLRDEAVAAAMESLRSTQFHSEDGRDFPTAALEQWKMVVQGTALGQETSEPDGLDELARMLSGDSPRETLQLLRSKIMARARVAFEALYRSVSELGLLQLRHDAKQLRGIPALRFDSPKYKQAQDGFERICDELWFGESDHLDFTEYYQLLSGLDVTRYHTHLIHAFLYAICGFWFSTRTLCRIALVALDMIDDAARDGVTGREAYYLMAVAERRLTDKGERLGIAEGHLADAVARSGGPVDPRFVSEKLAIRVCRLELISSAGMRPSFQDLLPLLADSDALTTGLAPTEPPSIRYWVIRQASTTGFRGALLAAEFGIATEEMAVIVLRLIDRMVRERLAPELSHPCDTERGRYHDEESDFVYLAACAYFAKDAADRIAARRAFFNLAEPRGLTRLESARRTRLRSFVTRVTAER
jgi:hypothetical protein